jgi:Septum formation initiator
MLKILGIVGLSILLVFIGVRVYGFFAQEETLNKDLADIETQLTKAQTTETNLQLEVQYLANPLNLEKELRAQFNYKKPGETMLIIVPGPTSTPGTD